jgi:hypothetical protein
LIDTDKTKEKEEKPVRLTIFFGSFLHICSFFLNFFFQNEGWNIRIFLNFLRVQSSSAALYLESERAALDLPGIPKKSMNQSEKDCCTPK